MGLRHTLVRNSWPTAPTMLDASVDSCIYVYVALETSRSRIRRRLEEDGWYLDRHGANHDIYRHLKVSGIITLPRHNILSIGVARSIAKKAGWPTASG